MATKARAQRQHFKRRMLARYQMEISNDTISKWIKTIQRNEATFVMKQSIRVSVFDIKHNDKIVRVVYDRKRKQLITALPADESVDWEKHQEQTWQ